MIEIKSVSGTVLYSSETHTVLSACLVEAVGKRFSQVFPKLLK
jgi:hypothetical protein